MISWGWGGDRGELPQKRTETMNPEDLAAMISTMNTAAATLAQASDARELAEARKAAEVCAFWLAKAQEAA